MSTFIPYFLLAVIFWLSLYHGTGWLVRQTKLYLNKQTEAEKARFFQKVNRYYDEV